MQQFSQFPQVELFVIQRCWFSGPQIEPSVDCRRLFTSRREAEEVAYHSAHAYANKRILVNNSLVDSKSFNPARRQNLDASVKTLLMPPSAVSGPTCISNYAFQTCGKLFWVRSLKATVVPHIGCNQAAGVTYPLSVSTLGGAAPNGEQTTVPFFTAEVVLTENIIGGTGNPNSRRGSEIAEGRVFVSTDPSNANRFAVETARQVHLSMEHSSHVKINVMNIPIGKPNRQSGPVVVVEDWPVIEAHRHWQHVQQPQQQLDPTTIMEDSSAKRDWVVVEEEDAASSNNSNPHNHHQQIVNRSSPPTKRRCHFFHQEQQHQQQQSEASKQTQEPSLMMM